MRTPYAWVHADEIRPGDYIALKWSENLDWISETVRNGTFTPDEERRVLAVRVNEGTLECYVIDPQIPEREAEWASYALDRCYLVTNVRKKLGLEA